MEYYYDLDELRLWKTNSEYSGSIDPRIRSKGRDVRGIVRRESINRAGDAEQREIGKGRRKTSASRPFVPPVVQSKQ